jgi:hypothetical protein
VTIVQQHRLAVPVDARSARVSARGRHVVFTSYAPWCQKIAIGRGMSTSSISRRGNPRAKALTAEDEGADGTMRARQNVIHEVGLFQGRLGFEKAILMLEDGCEEFSNVHGLDQIRFPKGRIKLAFEQVRQVLKREGSLIKVERGLHVDIGLETNAATGRTRRRDLPLTFSSAMGVVQVAKATPQRFRTLATRASPLAPPAGTGIGVAQPSRPACLEGRLGKSRTSPATLSGTSRDTRV